MLYAQQPWWMTTGNQRISQRDKELGSGFTWNDIASATTLLKSYYVEWDSIIVREGLYQIIKRINDDIYRRCLTLIFYIVFLSFSVPW